MAELSIIRLDETNPHQLYTHYSGQTNPQNCYLELDLDAGTLTADWNGEIGNALPFTVWHGRTHRYTIPALMAEAANALMDEIEPLAQRIYDGYECEWDGSNQVGHLSADAHAADEAITRIIEDRIGSGYWDDGGTCWAPDSDWWYDDHDAVTATTTDAEIEAIVDDHIEETRADSKAAVIDRDTVIDLYREYRDSLIDEQEA